MQPASLHPELRASSPDELGRTASHLHAQRNTGTLLDPNYHDVGSLQLSALRAFTSLSSSRSLHCVFLDPAILCLQGSDSSHAKAGACRHGISSLSPIGLRTSSSLCRVPLPRGVRENILAEPEYIGPIFHNIIYKESDTGRGLETRSLGL